MNRIFSVFTYILIITILGIISRSSSQESNHTDILAKLLEEDRLEEIAERLPHVAQKFPNSPTVLYLQGVLATNAKDAISYFEKIVQSHKDSQFADRAMMRIAQYHYAAGNYEMAANYFQAIINEFLDSPTRDNAAYYHAQCYLAKGDVDSARILLHQFIIDYQSSNLASAAIMDLELTEKQSQPSEDIPEITVPKSADAVRKYTVQIGAFKNKENAMRLVKKAMQLGYDVNGFRKGEGRQTVFVVWVGEFSTRAEAERFARDFQKKHRMKYIVIPKPD